MELTGKEKLRLIWKNARKRQGNSHRSREREAVRTGAMRRISEAAIYPILMAVGCIFLSAAGTLGGIYPCGTSLVTVLIGRGRLNIYLVPFILIPQMILIVNGSCTGGEILSVLASALIFSLLYRRRMPLLSRAVIAAAINVTAVCIYFMASNMMYRFDPAVLAGEAAAVVMLCFVFDMFFEAYLAGRGRRGGQQSDKTGRGAGKECAGGVDRRINGDDKQIRGDAAVDVDCGVPAEKAVAALTAVSILVVCGMGIESAAFSLPVAAAMFAVLFIGCRVGLLEGLGAAMTAGAALFVCGQAGTDVIMVLIMGGLAAGFMKGGGRPQTAVCFAAACFLPTLLRGGAGFDSSLIHGAAASAASAASAFAVASGAADIIHGAAALRSVSSPPAYEICAAALCWLALGERRLARLENLMLRPMDSRESYDPKTGERILDTLSAYAQTFSELALLYGSRRDVRTSLAPQFSGLLQTVEAMEKDIRKGNGRKEKIGTGKKSYKVSVGHSAYAGSEGISGDSFVYKEIGGARYVMALSDGMGKGSEAASESSLAVNTLLLLIEAGFSVENTLKTVNSVLLMRASDEIFSTIDLGILDLDTGRLKLLKMGSSPTFIKSGDKVSAFRTSALPMGIVDGLSLDFINVRLRPGDRLIMVSDGIADSLKGDAGGSWLSDTIANIRSQDPQTMADLIINRAVENYGIKEKDDLTVLTFKVEA